jgi:hypothetical protein
MRRIVLISCASKKLNHPAEARNLYVSPLFKKALAYANRLRPDNIFILSAKYYLLPLTQTIRPYDLTLNDMSKVEIKSWADKVIKRLGEESDLDKDEFIFLVGSNYRKFLIPRIKKYKVPLEGLGIGEQLKFLTERLQ